MSILELLLGDARAETLERFAEELNKALFQENIRAHTRLTTIKGMKRLAARRRAMEPSERELKALYRRQRDMEIMKMARRGWSNPEIAVKISADFPKAPISSPQTISRIVTGHMGGKSRRRIAQDAQEAPTVKDHTRNT